MASTAGQQPESLPDQRRAKLNKLGTEFKRNLLVLEDEITLRYDGPQDPQQLVDTPGFSLAKSVKVGTARVVRHRPRFPAGWQTGLSHRI